MPLDDWSQVLRIKWQTSIDRDNSNQSIRNRNDNGFSELLSLRNHSLRYIILHLFQHHAYTSPSYISFLWYQICPRRLSGSHDYQGNNRISLGKPINPLISSRFPHGYIRLRSQCDRTQALRACSDSIFFLWTREGSGICCDIRRDHRPLIRTLSRIQRYHEFPLTQVTRCYLHRDYRHDHRHYRNLTHHVELPPYQQDLEIAHYPFRRTPLFIRPVYEWRHPHRPTRHEVSGTLVVWFHLRNCHRCVDHMECVSYHR